MMHKRLFCNTFVSANINKKILLKSTSAGSDKQLLKSLRHKKHQTQRRIKLFQKPILPVAKPEAKVKGLLVQGIVPHIAEGIGSIQGNEAEVYLAYIR
jgi:hypothetical protein